MISPTTTADVVDPNDDLVSLREAVATANTTPGNQAAAGPALQASLDLKVTASAIGESEGPALCMAPADASSGGNIVVGGWCGFRATSSDHTQAPSLDLLPLADNGGPTRTRLPMTDGALAVIAPAACGVEPDQRGMPRPQGAACEAGAVEVAGVAGPTAPAPRFPANEFIDVPASADRAVDWALAHGIIVDRADHRFRPTNVVNRGQAVQFLWRMMGRPPVEGRMVFVDVSLTAPYRRAVKWAHARNITNILSFDSNGEASLFSPGRAVTRAELLWMLWHVAGQPQPAPNHQFTDAPASPALNWAAHLALLPSTTGTFRPGLGARRSAAVVWLHRAASSPGAWLDADPPQTSDF